MTVCIAALAENGDKGVICADKMVTRVIGGTVFQDEGSDHEKIVKLPSGCFVLTAGDESHSREIINQTLQYMNPGESAELTAERLRITFSAFRTNLIAQQEIANRGLGTIDDYYKKYSSLPTAITTVIDNALVNFHIGGVEFTIVGRGSDGKYKIIRLTQTATTYNHDQTGFCCTGSGAATAMTIMMEPKYNKALPLIEVKGIVERAKKASEIVQGVGSLTDLIELSSPDDEVKSALAKATEAAVEAASSQVKK